MAVHTILLDFPLGKRSDFSGEQGFTKIERLVIGSLEKFFGSETHEGVQKLFSDKTQQALFAGPRDSLLTLRLYRQRALATLNLEYYLNQGDTPLLSYQDCKSLEAGWAQEMQETKTVKTLPRILRGIPFDIYFPTTDERLLEYDIDRSLFDEQSPFQHVQVLHSRTFGNMLVLDDDPNLGESDLVYTDCIMGKEVYDQKEILILGGGDGALLNQLLKQKPKKVLMIEIDDVVMKACRKHLRSLSGDVLDQNIGSNYQIITGDCFPNMIELRERNVKFDFIFGDLTTLPISSGPGNEIWDFVRKVLHLSFGLLKPGGKYLTHAPGTSGPESAAMLEELLSKEHHGDTNLHIVKREVFVPSFSENWAFYSVQTSSGPTMRDNENKA